MECNVYPLTLSPPRWVYRVCTVGFEGAIGFGVQVLDAIML
jgi:hypothetical protein